MMNGASSSRCSAVRRLLGRWRRARSSATACGASLCLCALPPDDPEWQTRLAAFQQGFGGTGLDHWPQDRGSNTAWGGKRRADAPACGGPACARARYHPCQRNHGDATGDRCHAQCADRIHECRRSGRRRPCREPGEAWWQRHRLRAIRIRHERQMVGSAEADRAALEARFGPARSVLVHRHRATCRDHVGSAFAWRGGQPTRRACPGGNRTWSYGIRE